MKQIYILIVFLFFSLTAIKAQATDVIPELNEPWGGIAMIYISLKLL